MNCFVITYHSTESNRSNNTSREYFQIVEVCLTEARAKERIEFLLNEFPTLYSDGELDYTQSEIVN